MSYDYNRPLPKIPDSTPLSKPRGEKPTPPPKPENKRIDELAKGQLPQTPVKSSAKKPSFKASFNLGKTGEKLKKFFKRDKSSKGVIDSRINLNEIREKVGIHENMSEKEAEKLLYSYNRNSALYRTENGKTYITRLVFHPGTDKPNELINDRLDDKKFTSKEIKFINNEQKEIYYNWITGRQRPTPPPKPSKVENKNPEVVHPGIKNGALIQKHGVQPELNRKAAEKMINDKYHDDGMAAINAALTPNAAPVDLTENYALIRMENEKTIVTIKENGKFSDIPLDQFNLAAESRFQWIRPST